MLSYHKELLKQPHQQRRPAAAAGAGRDFTPGSPCVSSARPGAIPSSHSQRTRAAQGGEVPSRGSHGWWRSRESPPSRSLTHRTGRGRSVRSGVTKIQVDMTFLQMLRSWAPPLGDGRQRDHGRGRHPFPCRSVALQLSDLGSPRKYRGQRSRKATANMVETH